MSDAPFLKEVLCAESQIQTLDFTNNQNLEEVYASNSPLASINLPNNPNLEILDVDACQLTELDITNCPSLWYVSCGTNSLTNLDLSGNPLLEELINIADCQNLRTLYSPNTLLSELDLSQNPILFNVTLGDNPNLEMVNIKNGNNTGMSSFTAFNCPNLSCVVVDDPLADNDNILFGPNTNATLVGSVEECNELSINDNTLQNLIQVYPNPVSTILNINSNNIEVTKIEIYDVLGKKVWVTTEDTTQIGVSSLHSGLYLVNIQTEHGVLVKKIVKQ